MSRPLQAEGRFSRRTVLALAAGCAGSALGASAVGAGTDDEAFGFVERLTGKVPSPSERIRLAMPRRFPNGYTVPIGIEVDSPMTDADHVTALSILAPKNPLVEVATFRFLPGRVRPRVSTRIRLAEPQSVIALAETNDGALLLATTWVEVATNGCR